MNNGEYDFKDTHFDGEVEKAVRQSIKYLLEEGVIIKVGSKYRLKTKKEINKELEDILNSENE
jgi:phage antirepressor YoqD-like protein